MMTKIRAIEVSFAEPVELTQEDQHTLDALLNTICRRYVSENPHRVMWPFGMGAKMFCHPMMLSDDEPIPFDDTIYAVEVAERENYDWLCAKCGAKLLDHTIAPRSCQYEAAPKPGVSP